MDASPQTPGGGPLQRGKVPLFLAYLFCSRGRLPRHCRDHTNLFKPHALRVTAQHAARNLFRLGVLRCAFQTLAASAALGSERAAAVDRRLPVVSLPPKKPTISLPTDGSGGQRLYPRTSLGFADLLCAQPDCGSGCAEASALNSSVKGRAAGALRNDPDSSSACIRRKACLSHLFHSLLNAPEAGEVIFGVQFKHSQPGADGIVRGAQFDK